MYCSLTFDYGLPHDDFPAVPTSNVFFTQMGAKKGTLLKKNKKRSDSVPLHGEFLSLEDGPATKLAQQAKPIKDTATVLYIGRIPHGFYEKEMEGFFKQFGTIKHLRIARSKKTGNSKHYGYIEFESPEVAKIVADCMHNYLLFEHVLQVHLIPPESVHPRLWRARDYSLRPTPDWTEVERNKHNKIKTVLEHKKLVRGILKRDKRRRRKIEAAGIDFECPEIVASIRPAPKKIKFNNED